eukprot:TRINITY_DN46_c0_g1_i1.p1 TRINITY_DN46_c0_g1~~TRINITY_DN46_c0_g1_i1.p1  ORF type:complete len:190 (-),score=46.93 TRINITY_DN46_c0_g1_i1:68-637(-)
MKKKSKELPLQKVIVVGTGAVGKSSLTLRFMYDNFEEVYDPTAADSYRKMITIDGEEMNLDILDTAGQDEYASMRDSYYRTGEGFLAVYSIINRKSFDEITKFYEQICRVTEKVELPFVIVGNKCDLESQRQVQRTEGEEWAAKYGFPFFEASAKTNINVNDCFITLVKRVVEHKSKNGSGQKKNCILF